MSVRSRFKTIPFIDVLMGFIGVLAFVVVSSISRPASQAHKASDQFWAIIDMEVESRPPNAAGAPTKAASPQRRVFVDDLFGAEEGAELQVQAILRSADKHRLVGYVVRKRTGDAKAARAPIDLALIRPEEWLESFRVTRIRAWGDRRPDGADSSSRPIVSADEIKATLTTQLSDVSSLKFNIAVNQSPSGK